MTLQQTTLGSRSASNQDLVRIVLAAAAVLVLIVVLAVIFSVAHVGPSYEIVVDPAAAAGLPF